VPLRDVDIDAFAHLQRACVCVAVSNVVENVVMLMCVDTQL